MERNQYNLSELVPVMLKVFAKGGTFSFYPSGTSMQPFLVQGRDKVILSQTPEKLEKYQMVLYRRDNGAYVLHRIVGMERDTFVMRGDNQYLDEPGIRREQIIGIVTAIERDGKLHKADSFENKIFAVLWVESAELRKWCGKLRCKSIYKKVRRLLHKIRKKL